MTYDKLLIESESNGLTIKEKPLSYGFKGLYKNKKIIINQKINTSSEKRCILAEELGHHYTSFGNILDQSNIINVKQEKRARNWGYEKLVGIISLINAFERGIKGRHDLAEYLNVTEKFLEDALKHYKEKYGIYYEIDNYIVYFQPSLTVLKIF
ncbi:ImmA/IrrE family metallo-endopeptidase [Clostridium sp. P21]|uniref:ImmA/IrrE family metallo-endopeptidase n=1 Tax=Clostridium muellerianum TaxID=2716538 RepID=A0A7Y0EFU2_9CLOT|nr:ImmA/IrrE family metallo-endopeptidase [Clostridium muellerianum]NMM62352.1 ImmA/IrrE family metallo-endopeptidase [Clostridium muellerianum]